MVIFLSICKIIRIKFVFVLIVSFAVLSGRRGHSDWLGHLGTCCPALPDYTQSYSEGLHGALGPWVLSLNVAGVGATLSARPCACQPGFWGLRDAPLTQTGPSGQEAPVLGLSMEEPLYPAHLSNVNRSQFTLLKLRLGNQKLP